MHLFQQIFHSQNYKWNQITILFYYNLCEFIIVILGTTQRHMYIILNHLLSCPQREALYNDNKRGTAVWYTDVPISNSCILVLVIHIYLWMFSTSSNLTHEINVLFQKKSLWTRSDMFDSYCTFTILSLIGKCCWMNIKTRFYNIF